MITAGFNFASLISPRLHGGDIPEVFIFDSIQVFPKKSIYLFVDDEKLLFNRRSIMLFVKKRMFKKYKKTPLRPESGCLIFQVFALKLNRYLASLN